MLTVYPIIFSCCPGNKVFYKILKKLFGKALVNKRNIFTFAENLRYCIFCVTFIVVLYVLDFRIGFKIRRCTMACK